MSLGKKLKYASNIFLALGFLIPLFASNFVGMSLYEKPAVSASTVILWVMALTCGYFSFLEEKKQDPSVPLWLRICRYIVADSSQWLVIGVLFGYLYYPTVSTSPVAASMNYYLALSLFVMGLNISPSDWKRILESPKLVIVSVLIKWICKPLISLIVGKFVFGLFLPEETANQLILGLVLLGTTATGTASNTLTLISRGDLALSVSVTGINTILTPILQPLILMFLVSAMAKVDSTTMFMDLGKLVIVPVIIGCVLGVLLPNAINKIKPVTAPIAVLCLGLVMLSSMSKGTGTLISQLYVLPFMIIADLLYGFAGLSLGFILPKYFGFDEKQRRAACYEVGVENAALTATLALNFFNPLTALPGILYGKIQNILAATIFVPIFLKRDDKMEQEKKIGIDNMELDKNISMKTN